MIDYSNHKAEDLLLDDSFLAYCKGEDQANIAFWNNLQVTQPALRPEIARALELYQTFNLSLSTKEKDEALNRLKASISEQRLQSSEEGILVDMKPRRGWLRYAAAAVLVAGIAATAILFANTSAKHKETVADLTSLQYKETYRSSEEQRREIKLPDGSTALLNYGSTLKLADGYNDKSRCLYLEGEAFFEVKKDADRPFIVITNKTATTALGTSFKVRSYLGEDNGNIMLATGKVKVESLVSGPNKVADLNLLPGDEATWTSDGRMQQTTFDMAMLNDWRHTRIVFDRANLPRIIESLRFYYGVNVSMVNRPRIPIAFTGKFYEKSLKEVLEAMAFTNKFTYSQKGNIVSIEFQ